MNPDIVQFLAGPGGMLVLFILVAAAVNAYSYWLYNRVLNLVVVAAGNSEKLIGDHVAGLYTKYLYGQVMAGNFYTPNTIVVGNPENDRVVREVKRSAEYADIREKASWVRNLPINVVPYCV